MVIGNNHLCFYQLFYLSCFIIFLFSFTSLSCVTAASVFYSINRRSLSLSHLPLCLQSQYQCCAEL